MNKAHTTTLLKRIQEALKATHTDALLISTNVNLYYLLGRIVTGYAYIPQEGEMTLFVKRPLGITEKGVIYIRKPEDMLPYLHTQGKNAPKSLMLESDKLAYNECNRLLAAWEHPILHNGSELLRNLRAVKTPYEIEQFEESARRHLSTYAAIPSLYRAGMSDYELSMELEHEARRQGSLGIFRVNGESMEIFMGSVLVGENADTPSPYDFAMGGAGMHPSLPVGCNGTTITLGQSIMIDMCGNYTGYITDITRTYAVGELPPLAHRAHQASIEIQQAIASAGRPGAKTSDLYAIAIKIAEEAELMPYFMGYTQHAAFVGHGVGLEINELPVITPRSREVLQENMVIALEPKFVIPGVGGVGTENTYVVTPQGMRCLTCSPSEIVRLG